MEHPMIVKMKKACEKYGIKKAVIGISGGKDSTVVAKLLVEALGKENVVGVLMPNGEQKDIGDSQDVVSLLGITGICVNIADGYHGLYQDIDSALLPLDSGISAEANVNIAPRLRMTTLYTIAQSLGGYRVIGTTNRSEDYIGWFTKWGDGGADFEPIIEITAGEVVQLGLELGLPEYLVKKTPADGLTKYTDEDRFGFSYKQLDDYILTGTSGDKDVDDKIKKMHDYSEHKRSPIPRIYK